MNAPTGERKPSCYIPTRANTAPYCRTRTIVSMASTALGSRSSQNGLDPSNRSIVSTKTNPMSTMAFWVTNRARSCCIAFMTDDYG